MLIVIILLIILVLIAILLVNNSKENFQVNDGYQEACAEITRKRLFLRAYIQQLRAPVQDLSASLIDAYYGKDENMNFQNNLTTLCVQHIKKGDVMGDACKSLASVDAYEFQVLPDLDIFYHNLLTGGYDLNALLEQLNFYSSLMNCPLQAGTQATFDASDNEIDVSRDIGDVDTETLALELEKLSPYYLSPAVVRYLIKFLISKEQLDQLDYTSSDYIKQEVKLMNTIKNYY